MQRWTDNLPRCVYNRLCNCHSLQPDIKTLVNAKWSFMIAAGKKDQGFTKEDALISVLELLACNGQFFDLTHEEYNKLKHE